MSDEERELDKWVRRHGTPYSRPPKRPYTNVDLLIAFALGVLVAWLIRRWF